MAKLTGPLMSFGARGKLGGSLVYSAWKGVNTVRQLVTPANPNTTAQIAQRTRMASIVAAWRNTDLSSAIRTAWNKLAQLTGNPVSGFNQFTSQLVKLAAEDPAASIVTSIEDEAAASVTLGLLNLDDMTTGDEAGSFHVSYGVAPDQLLYEADPTIAAGVLAFNPSSKGFKAGDLLFVRVTKAGTGTAVYDRSGVVAITLS